VRGQEAVTLGVSCPVSGTVHQTMEWLRHRWVEILIVGLAQAAVGLVATWSLRQLLAHEVAKDVGIIIIWLAVMAGGIALLIVRPWQQSEKTIVARAAELYENRTVLNELRKGIRTELGTASRLWVAWPGGTTVIATVDAADIRRIDRMILRDPYGDTLADYTAQAGRSREDAASDILETTRIARREGVNVRWLSKPLISVVFGDPETQHGWFRHEVILPYTPAVKWPSIVISRSSYPALYEAMRDAYEGMWHESREPGPEELGSG